MYAVVGCSACSALWVVEGRPETTGCPRCRMRHRFEKLKQFVTTDDRDHAREVRASMLAERQGHGEAFAELDSFAEMDARIDEAVVSDEEYLSGSGLDPAEVAEAGERAAAGATGGHRSRLNVVRDALREHDAPTEETVVAYAAARDVPEAYVRNALAKLTRAGEVSESRGRYRLV